MRLCSGEWEVGCGDWGAEERLVDCGGRGAEERLVDCGSRGARKSVVDGESRGAGGRRVIVKKVEPRRPRVPTNTTDLATHRTLQLTP